MRIAPLAVLLALACQPAAGDPSADLVLAGGRVRTCDGAVADAQAVAVRGARIVAVGSDDDVLALAGPATRRIDLHGRCVVPGFVDAHVHFLTGGFELLGPDLHGTKSEREFAERLRAAARRVPAGTWITGGGWDHEAWPGHAWPRRAGVDPLVPDHPVFVRRTDGHVAFANGKALALAGVDRDTKDPAGGVILRDAYGRPTGVLKDAAMDLVAAVIPEPDFAAKLSAARAAMQLARANGVTTVHDMATAGDLAVYRRLEERGELTVRVRFYFPIARRALAYRERGNGSDRLRVNGVKAFADGSLGASTAFMFEPFADEPDNRGLRDAMFEDRDAFLTKILEVDRNGLQVCVHAIGDRANREVLDVFAEVARQHGARDRRMRIEHAQHLTPADIERFAPLGVIASVQPYHCIDDGRWAERKLGEARSRWTYAFRSLLDAGARVAFGSDWFVAPLDPVQTLYAAVTRATLDGARPGGWVPEEKVGIAESLACMTREGAYAGFDEDALGRIAPGLFADLVVLSEDPLETEPERLHEIRVDLTVAGGRIVHERER